ncbi:hypothetical protein HYX16_01285 [Candidatus Woesearchaeota archaeon]|nr:hypothetical protein [Candidatus Woesearchaeota archaeon]
MTKALPKWVMNRYAKLWGKFNNKEFTHSLASKFLKEPKTTTLSLVIAELKKAGWLDVSLEKNDSRKRLYKLKKPEEVMKEIAK